MSVREGARAVGGSGRWERFGTAAVGKGNWESGRAKYQPEELGLASWRVWQVLQCFGSSAVFGVAAYFLQCGGRNRKQAVL